MKLLLSMGLKPHGRTGEPLRPALRWLDPDTGRVEDIAGVPGLAHHPSAADHAECTGAHRLGDRLWQTTRTEVLTLSWPDLAVLERFSHPLLHDVHDALPLPDGGFAVTATGHDSVLRFDARGELVTHWWLGGDTASFPAAYPGITDFRRVPFAATKPHAVHPNHLVWMDDALWVTCLHTQQLRCLTQARAPLAVPEGPPHDGRWHDGLLWLTTVNGRVLAVDPATGQRRIDLDLHDLDPTPGLPGWCRALTVVDHRLFVGMTTLRRAAHTEVARQLLRGAAGRKKPTRVVEIDLRTHQIVAQHPVGNAAGGTLYALTAWT